MTGPEQLAVDDRIGALERRLAEHELHSAYARCYAAAAALTVLFPLLPMEETASTIWAITDNSGSEARSAQLALCLAGVLFAMLVTAAFRHFTSSLFAWLVAGIATVSGAVQWYVGGVSAPRGWDITASFIGGVVITFIVAILGAVHALHLRARRFSA